MSRYERIAVCGLGKLGACVAALMADAGHDVVGYDSDGKKILSILERKAPVQEAGLDEFYRSELVKITWKVAEAVAASEIGIFVVPTPSNRDGSFSTAYLTAALRAFATEVQKQGKAHYTFVISSTTSPNSCETVYKPLLKAILKKGFSLCYKPEFIALGSVLHNMRNPDFILLGEQTGTWLPGDRVEALYRTIAKSPALPCKRMSLTEAELAKISLNCAITMKISFANQVGEVARQYGSDAAKILDAIGADSRIGPKAMVPGLPYGGPCFPRDNRAFQTAAGYAPLAAATDAMNTHLKMNILDRVHGALGGKKTARRVGILGQAYKPGTAQTDQSFGVWLKDELERRFCEVLTHDPQAPCTHHDQRDVLACPIVVIACPWPQYQWVTVPEKTFLIDPMRFVNLKPAQVKHAKA